MPDLATSHKASQENEKIHLRAAWRRIFFDACDLAMRLKELALAVKEGDSAAASKLAAKVLEADERGEL